MEMNSSTISDKLYIKGRIGWKGLKKEEYLENSDFRIINATALHHGEIDWTDCGYISKDRYEESPEIMLKEKDILISKDGTIGKIGYVNNLNMKTTVASGIFVVRNLNEKEIDTDYLYYFFKSPYFKWFINSSTEGSVVPHLYQRDFEKMEINLFDKKSQIKISTILNNIENKIKIINKINNNLENILKNLFYSWFIKFERYKGNFKTSKIGDIPENWELIPLGDLVKVIDNRGKTPPLVEDNVAFPIIDVRALSGSSRIVDYNKCTKYVNKETYDGWFRSGHPQEFDILISTVGSIAELKLFLGSKGCLAQNVVALRSEEEYSLYLYQYLKYIKKDLEAYNIGSVQPSIKVTHILKHLILIPDKNNLKKFNELSLKITKLLYDNSLELNKLTILRDTLLPKLMSGEIDVSDINFD